MESVLAQDLDPKDYEVILVDDGSTDGSGEICDSLAERQKGGRAEGQKGNIKVLHQKNQGLSAARNAGIAVAKGKYIQFVDSDDYLEPNVLAGLVEQMERENLDVLRFDYNIVNEHGQTFWPGKHNPKVYDSSRQVTTGEVYLDTRFSTQCYACQFMIKVDLFAEGNLRFKEGVYFEDTEWTPRLFWTASRVNYSDTIVYNYLWRVGTISRNRNVTKKKKTICDLMTIIEGHVSNMRQHPDSVWLQNLIHNLTINLLGIAAVYDFKNAKSYIHHLKKIGALPMSLFQAYCFVIKSCVKQKIYYLVYK